MKRERDKSGKESRLPPFEALLGATRPFVHGVSAYPWTEDESAEGVRQLLLRAILRRQFESLEAIAALVRQSRGDSAAVILRPLCEELIWLEYSLSLSNEDAGALFLCLANVGIFQTFLAQKGYERDRKMRQLDFPPGTEAALGEAAARAESRLVELATKLAGRNRAVRGPQFLR